MNNETKRFAHKLNLQLFAEGDPKDPPNDPQDPPADPEPTTVTMTQEELNALIGREKARAKKPFADYEDLKTRVAELQAAEDERKRGELTEVERIKADLEREAGAKQTLESELTTLRESVKQERIRSAFITAATTAKIAYIDDAWALADKSGISVGDDGNVVGIDEVISGLVTEKPFLVVQTTKPKTIGSPTDNPPPAQKTAEQLLKEAADKAKQSGRLEDQAAYAKLKRELNL